MSSSAPKRQPVPEASPFAYAEAGLPSDAAGSAPDAGDAAEQRSRRLAEVFEQGRQSGLQQLRSESDSALVKNRQQIGDALRRFALERQDYYRRVEGEIVELALTALDRLTHRGGVDSDGLSGDGAGLLLPIPAEFFRSRAQDANIFLPEAFGLGMVFLPFTDVHYVGRSRCSSGAIRAFTVSVLWMVRRSLHFEKAVRQTFNCTPVCAGHPDASHAFMRS